MLQPFKYCFAVNSMGKTLDTGMIFVDLQKVSDILNYEILLVKEKYFVFRIPAIE